MFPLDRGIGGVKKATTKNLTPFLTFPDIYSEKSIKKIFLKKIMWGVKKAKKNFFSKKIFFRKNIFFKIFANFLRFFSRKFRRPRMRPKMSGAEKHAN